MKASTCAATGGVGFEIGNRSGRVLCGLKELRSRNRGVSVGWGNRCVLRLGSVGMRSEFTRAVTRVGGVSVFGSSAKARSVRAQASEDHEDVALTASHGSSSGSVLPYVGVACLGAIVFGYHLGVVNGALEYLAKDLGIAENAVLQGWIVSSSLAGATLGSFTGGTLADKFGRTRAFQLNAIPLAVGAFLCASAQNVETMIIGRLLAGIDIGISSAIVPLYISEGTTFTVLY